MQGNRRSPFRQMTALSVRKGKRSHARGKALPTKPLIVIIVEGPIDCKYGEFEEHMMDVPRFDSGYSGRLTITAVNGHITTRRPDDQSVSRKTMTISASSVWGYSDNAGVYMVPASVIKQKAMCDHWSVCPCAATMRGMRGGGGLDG